MVMVWVCGGDGMVAARYCGGDSDGQVVVVVIFSIKRKNKAIIIIKKDAILETETEL